MVDTGEIHRNSVIVRHRDRARFLAAILPDLKILPYMQRDVPITWRAIGLLRIKKGDNWITPERYGSSPLDLVDGLYSIYVVEQPIIMNKFGEEFQVTDDLTITFGQQPYQRPFKVDEVRVIERAEITGYSIMPDGTIEPEGHITKERRIQIKDKAQRKMERRSFPVTDPDLDAPDGAVVDGFERHGDTWEEVVEGLPSGLKHAVENNLCGFNGCTFQFGHRPSTHSWEVKPVKNCYKHGQDPCSCRPSTCCSRYTHGCSLVNHKFFDPDDNGA